MQFLKFISVINRPTVPQAYTTGQEKTRPRINGHDFFKYLSIFTILSLTI